MTKIYFHLQKNKNRAVINLKDNKDLVKDILIAKLPLPNGKHVIDFQVSYADHLILGIGNTI